MNSHPASAPILCIPSQRPGQGGGHLARMGQLVLALRASGLEAYLLSDAPNPASTQLPVLSADQAKTVPSWRYIVIDDFRTDPDTFHEWVGRAPLLGIDEGGPCRDSFDFLVDILPGPKSLTGFVRLLSPAAPALSRFSFFRILCRRAGSSDTANLSSPAFLELPSRRREGFPPEEAVLKSSNTPSSEERHILVAFGAEDATGLSLPVVRSLLAAQAGYRISLVIGPRNRGITLDQRKHLGSLGVELLDAPRRLSELLADFDLIITHFGLTAFEALAAKVPAALVSPSGYHEVLSLKAGFYSFGCGTGAAGRVGRLLAHQSVQRAILNQSRKVARDYALQGSGNSLAATLGSWTFPTGGRCPLCQDHSRRNTKLLARFPDRTYFRCGTCGISYMVRPAEPPITYDGAYFLEDYKKQYGKTYIEDFPNLVRMAHSRLEHIRTILLQAPQTAEPLRIAKPVRILDIGCAYGPLLAAAKALGWNAFGLDPSSDAVRHVREQVGVPVVQGLFPETDLTELTGGLPLDAVSLWYVIEHFQDIHSTLEAAARLLRQGGVLAFSTPSGTGISGRFRNRFFLEQSPPDHWTIWSPQTCGPLLARFGFRLVKIVHTGHHPERFPLLGPFAKSKKTVIYRVLFRISQIFSLGDTFEAYAVKE